MDSNLSLIASAILGAIFLLGLVRFYVGVTDYTHEQTYQLLTQENATVIMQIVEDDIRKMGTGSPPAMGNSILSYTGPDSADITFQADIDGDGSAESVRYHVSYTSGAPMTLNPDDRFLIRDIDSGVSIDSLIGISKFNLELQNQWGQPIAASWDSTWIVKISLVVESAQPYTQNEQTGAVYTTSFAEKTIMPEGLIRFTANAIP